MLITVSGPHGEGKTCIANIIRNALVGYGFDPEMGKIPIIDHEIAADVMSKRVDIRICEEKDT